MVWPVETALLETVESDPDSAGFSAGSSANAFHKKIAEHAKSTDKICTIRFIPGEIFVLKEDIL